MHRLLDTANVPSSLIFVTLMMEAQSSSEKSVLTRAARHNIQEDSIHNYKIKSKLILYLNTGYYEAEVNFYFAAQRVKDENLCVVCVPTSYQARQLIVNHKLQLGDLYMYPKVCCPIQLVIDSLN
jgi:ribose 5-phosphate isomerase